MGIAFIPRVAGQNVPSLPLATFEHPSGNFRIDLPSGWGVEADYELAELGRADAVAFGPVQDGFRTNIVVVSETGFARDSDEFLIRMAEDAIEEIQQEVFSDPTDPPVVIETRNSRGVIFGMRLYLPEGEVAQMHGVVADEGRSRIIAIVGSSARSVEAAWQATFEAVIMSFEVLPVLPPPLFRSPIAYVLFGGLAGAAVGVSVFAFRRWKGARPKAPPAQALRPESERAPSAPPMLEATLVEEEKPVAKYCPYCGSPLQPPGRFCSFCGARLPFTSRR
ncbi:MAG: zinc ribbon domain-containing protein [Thermoplasmata archaeon]